MASPDCECLVIGAGVVGLACAAKMSDRCDTLLLEGEKRFGLHTSSRNSEVLHSGIYYPTGSLKARLSLLGNQKTRIFCKEMSIPCHEIGKYILALSADEVPTLNELFCQGKRNGVSGITRIEAGRLPDAPHLHPVAAGIWVPSAATIDSHRFMAALEQSALARRADIVYGAQVVQIEKQDCLYRITTQTRDVVSASKVINCSGLWAHETAAMAGIGEARHALRQYWCKGVYFKSSRIRNFPRLIYPIPPSDGQSLGIHLTVNTAGEVRFGPDAQFVNQVDYRFPSDRRSTFHREINRYMDVSAEELTADDCGIRAKLQGPEDGFRDFYIREEKDRGLGGFVNCLGIESPGLTSAMAIADYVANLLE